MKYFSTAIGAPALVAVAVFAGNAPVKFNGLRISSPRTITVPATPDSASGRENAFRNSDLLGQNAPVGSALQMQRDERLRKLFGAQMQDWTTILPDTAGVYHLPKTDSEAVSIRRLKTSVRPQGFFKGTLKASTPMAARMYVNGEKVAEKASVDTVSKELSSALTLEPYQDAEIILDLLAEPGMKAEPEVSMYVVPDEGSENVALSENPEKGFFNVATTTIGPKVASVDISPDGKYMIVCTSNTPDGKKTVYSYDIRECATGKVIRMNYGGGTGWLPGEASTLYFNISQPDGTFDIIREAFPGGERTLLAAALPEEASDYTISPSADYLVYSVKKEGDKDSGVMRRVRNPDDRIPANRDRYYLNAIYFNDGIVRPLTAGGPSTYLADISADGKSILYTCNYEKPSEYPFYDASLVRLDTRTLKADTLARGTAGISEALFSPDATKVFIVAGPNEFGGIGRNAGSHEIANDFDMQGYMLDLRTKEVKALTRDFDPSINNTAIWNRADGNIYFRGIVGFDCKLYRLNPGSGKIEELPTDIDYLRSFSIGEKDRRWIAYTGMGDTYNGRACLLNLKTMKSTLIADPMNPIMSRIQFGDSQMWSFTAKDGTIVEGSVTLPPDFTPEKKYPMIVYYYGGTTPSIHGSHSPYAAQLFASRGYVVYVLNPSGTIGYGQEYSARHVNAWGERTADEIIQGVMKFCEAHPFVDSSRIGCLGASYGGFMTQLLTTKTDIFAAAVSHAGISNVTSYWGEGYWGYSYNAVAAARSYPWSNPDIYTRNSSLFNADKIHTPLLLLHGSVDTNVPIGESIQLYNALKILGRDVEFITIDDENHIVMDFQKRKEWHATIMAWFEKWLKGDSRWWDSIYK